MKWQWPETMLIVQAAARVCMCFLQARLSPNVARRWQ